MIRKIFLLSATLLTIRYVLLIPRLLSDSDTIQFDSTFESIEDRLVRHQPVNFTSLDEVDLSLIWFITRPALVRLAMRRDEITDAAKRLPIKDRYKALQQVRGIGPKTAKKIGPFLKFD
jgi:hypothetical protein